MGTTHMVSAGHYLATAAGYRILEQGGNAIDAGVASGIAINIEWRIPERTVHELANRGHDIVVLPDWTTSTGGLSGITIDQQTGVLKAGADPRRDNYAVGR